MARPQYVYVPSTPGSSLRQFVTKPEAGSTSTVRGPLSVTSATPIVSPSGEADRVASANADSRSGTFSTTMSELTR